MRCALVVDDSKFMRTVVGNELREHGYEVVEASNGKQALEAVEIHNPDVITMDVAMPEMNGIEAVEHIMNWRPTPILMVSAYTADGAEATLDALQKGAVGFIQKPGGEVSIETRPLEDELIEKVEAAIGADAEVLSPGDSADEPGDEGSDGSDRAIDAATEASAESVSADTRAVDAAAEAVEAAAEAVEAVSDAEAVNTTADAATADVSDARETTDATPEDGQTAVELPPRPDDGADSSREPAPGVAERYRAAEYVDDPTIVIGASTGGPKILNDILRTLPRELSARVLVVQHMPESFTGRFAVRLDGVSGYEVAEARDGERIGPGQVRVAHGDSHLKVADDSAGQLTLELIDDQLSRTVRPAIDVTMETAAAAVEQPLVGVALTGMGSDGAAGIRAIKEAGGSTIVQDEETSPVFGIPQKAIETGCVDQVLAAEEIVEGVLETFITEGD